MKLFHFIILLPIFCFSLSPEQLEFNKNFNNTIYLIRQSHYYLENHKVNQIKFYSNQHLLRTIKATGTINQDKNTGKVVAELMNLDTTITRVVIDNYSIGIKNINLGVDNHPSLLAFNQEHVSFCVRIKTVRHDHHPNYTYNDRLTKHGIVDARNGLQSENCGKIYVQEHHKSLRMMACRTIYTYWTNRRRTLHFAMMMVKSFRFFSSSFIYDKNTSYVYSTTFFAENRVSVL